MDPLIIAGRTFDSRLLIGTGKYRDFAETRAAIDASGAQIVTVAIRRLCSTRFRHRSSPICPIPPGVTTPKTPCARCALRVNCSTVTIW